MSKRCVVGVIKLSKLQNLKQQLQAEYPYKFELHAHSSPASGCSDLPPAELVERCKNAGAHGLVLTNHIGWWMRAEEKELFCKRYLQDYLDTKEAGDKLGIKVLFGFEARFPENENDYLIFGFDTNFIPDMYEHVGTSEQEFFTACHSEDVLILQAHPFRKNMVPVDPTYLDGYEVFNLHPGHNSRVAVASKLHAQHGGVITGGTDLHHRDHEGSLFTCFSQMPEDEKALVHLLRSGDYVFMTADKVILG